MSSSKTSIVIVNSSHSSLDDVTSMLKTLIRSGQRPNVVCLTQEEIQSTNPVQFMKEFIDEQLTKCRLTMEKSQKIEDFNQLTAWQEEIKSKKEKNKNAKSRESNSTAKRDLAQNIIIDFPLDYASIELYVVLFDVFDCELIKTLISIDSSLKTIVNLYPRNFHQLDEMAIKSEDFWDNLMREKLTKAFDDTAFVDLDVPVESRYMLNLRSKLIYDQFCHFIYDLEDIKSSYARFYRRLEISAVNGDDASDDLRELKKKFEKIPECLGTVEMLYDTLLDQVCGESRRSSLKLVSTGHSLKAFQISVFGKLLTDLNDNWFAGYSEASKIYVSRLEKLQKSLGMWDDVDKVSTAKRQLLNHFMGKVMKLLEANGAFDHLEFYIYAFQFDLMGRKLASDESCKSFYEDRSVGWGSQKGLRALTAVSDFHLDYFNTYKIPQEIAELVDDTSALLDINSDKTFHVQMFSPPALIQHLSNLMEVHPDPIHFYSQLMDVMLIKLPKRTIPKIFATKVYSKVLPTPLCFRDFNDFMEQEMEIEDKKKTSENFASGDEIRSLWNSKDFVLAGSVKSRTMNNKIENKAEEENLQIEGVVEAEEGNSMFVYDFSNQWVEFTVTESSFNSTHISAKAMNFCQRNHQRVLNIYCELESVGLSISHDFNQLQVANLTTSSGMKFSFESDEQRASIAFPSGISMKILDGGVVEQSMGENKRFLFSNGFIYDAAANTAYAANGAIFELREKARKSFRNSQASTPVDDSIATTSLLQDTISSIDFLDDFSSFSGFILTLSSGERYNVENKVVTDKFTSLASEEIFDKTTGNLHIQRDDGVKIVHAKDFSKTLFPDGTVITTRLCDKSVATCSDEPEVIKSILDEIWTTESKNESQFILHHVLNQVSSDYFLHVSRSYQFEHINYGSVHFDGKVELQILNETSLKMNSGRFLMTFEDGITFELDDSHLSLMGGMCSECDGFNEVFMDLSLEDGDTADDTKKLATIKDKQGNMLEIKKSGRHAFYANDTYDAMRCHRCNIVKNDFEQESFGERCTVVNRDYSGYEIMPSNTKKAQNTFSETHDELLLQARPLTATINFDAFNCPTEPCTAENSKSILTPSPAPSENLKSPSVANSIRSGRKSSARAKRRSKKSIVESQSEVEVEKEPQPSTWLTEDPSLSLDIPSKMRRLIQFHANPLDSLPSTISVGPMIKLNNKFNNVTEAILHLKKYSTEKFIINAKQLNEMPVGKKTFEANFKLVAEKTLANHIQKHLECYRHDLADAIVKDLLKKTFKPKDNSEMNEETSIELKNQSEIEHSEESAVPVAIKSFSFS